MTVFYLRRDSDDSVELSQSRIGFTVRKVLGGAVQRNRMKRRLREAVRLQPVRPEGVDVVINPKASLLNADFGELKTEIARAFQVIRKSFFQESSRTP